MKKIKITIAEIIQLVGANNNYTGILQRVSRSLTLQERMSIAVIIRRLKEFRDDFHESIRKVDISAFMEAKNAAIEKYKTATNDEAMGALTDELELLETMYAEKIADYKKASAEADKTARELVEVEILPIRQWLVEKMELEPGDLEAMFPIIEGIDDNALQEFRSE